MFVDLLFIGSCVLLVHAYWGYSTLLKYIVEGAKTKGPVSVKDKVVGKTDNLVGVSDVSSALSSPNITVLLTVYNEEAFIEKRLLNLLNCVKDSLSLQILVCSDGSTDATEAIVATMAKQYPCIELFASGKRLGKTGSQNEALVKVRGDIIVFTDAETAFAPDCLVKIVAPFVDPTVGGTTGALYFNSEGESAIVSNQQDYWTQELNVRANESSLGFLCVATGACMAIRRSLYIPPSTAYGEDCVLPLDVVLAGYKMVHVSDAIAFDNPSTSVSSEFATRVRMTERNLTGTFSRRKLLNPLRYPKECFSLVSHKLLKWFTPWLLSIIVITAAIQSVDSTFYRVVLLLTTVVSILAVVGYFAQKYPGSLAARIPLAAMLFSFFLANVGFAVGGLRALVGVRTTTF